MLSKQDIIEDLLDTYSSNLHMPLFIINSSGEIRSKVNIHLAEDTSLYLTEQLVQVILGIAPTIKSPSVINSTEELESIPKYVFSPLIHSVAEDYFILVGPFIEKQLLKDETISKSILETQYQQNIPLIHSEQKVTVLNKIEKLTNILITINHEANFRIFREESISLALDFSFFKKKGPMFERLLSITDLDFIGYANKNAREQFKVETILGEQVEALQDQSFFIGEGLLGQAVASGKEIYWKNNKQVKREEFFFRFGLVPQYLLCYPVKTSSEVNGLVFGGRFQNTPIQPEILDMIKCFVHFLSEGKQVHTMFDDGNRSSRYVNSLVDLLDIFFSSKDIYDLLFKILYICYQLNRETFVCLTLNDEYFQRGETDQRMKLEHEKALSSTEALLARKKHLGETDRKVIHLSIDWNGSNYGVLTTTVGLRGTDEEEQERVLDVFVKLLSMKCSTQMLQDPYAQRTGVSSSLLEPFKGMVSPREEDQKKELKNKEVKVELDREEIKKISDLKSVIAQLPITLREQEILFLILEGLNNCEVADYLKISPHTVKNHITSIFRKLNVSDRIHAMAKIYRIKYGID